MNAINISTRSGFSRWQPACWLRAHGADAETFLQGQFSNDLRLLDRQPAVYGLWLSVKGRVLADSFVLRGESSFWIGSYFSPVDAIRNRLESHIIADDVVLDDVTAEWAGLSLLGDTAAPVPPGVGRDVLVFPGRRARRGSVECVGPAAAIAEMSATLRSLPELDGESLERIRITDGIPAVPADLGPADLPNEGGLEADAISYTKGCYLGQEVMARLKSMGQVRRQLWRVRGGGGIPALPAPLFAGGRQVGELRSAARDGADGFIGMALLSLLHMNTATGLALGPDAPANLRVMNPA